MIIPENQKFIFFTLLNGQVTPPPPGTFIMLTEPGEGMNIETGAKKMITESP